MLSTGMTYFLTLVIVYILIVWGALIPFRAGLLYNGTIYCMAIGGYFAGFASKTLGWPFPLAILGAVVIGAIFGFLPALGFSRTSGIVTAVSSMALIFIIQSVIRNLSFLGGSNGMTGIPKIDNLLLYAFIILVIVGIFMLRLNNSRTGRALEAIQTDPQMAETLGINNRRITILALTLSSVLSALGGAIYAFNIRVIYPGTFSFTLLLNVMTMLFVGGRFTQWGILISAPLLWSLNVFMPKDVQKLSNYIYAVILIVILMLMPEGIITRGTVNKISCFVERKFSRIFKRSKSAAKL